VEQHLQHDEVNMLGIVLLLYTLRLTCIQQASVVSEHHLFANTEKFMIYISCQYSLPFQDVFVRSIA